MKTGITKAAATISIILTNKTSNLKHHQMNKYYHSGKLGDIIYSLPTVRAMGMGEMILNVSNADFENIAPLLRAAIQVRQGSMSDTTGSIINLNRFRQHPKTDKIHLVDSHAEMQGVKVSKQPWIWLNVPRSGYAVINRSGRHQDKFMNWRKELKHLRDQYGAVVFLGTREEHAAFEKQYKILIRYQRTDNLLEAARVIMGAAMFSGNQSALLAIRQAMGLPYRMEQSPHHSNCTTGLPHEKILNPVTRVIHKILAKAA